MPDIDIDFFDRTKSLDVIQHITAANGNKKHNTGIYIQNIPHNPLTGLSTIDYKEAENRGYFKVDFLNVSVYNGVRDRAHLQELMDTEPLWDLLQDEEFVNLLFHINGHSSILKQMMPRSVEQLAAVLAVIRPAKRHLLGKDWTTVMNEVWIKPEKDEYYFKKAHAVAYAMAIVVQMNLICEDVSRGYS
jgi:hypothetical protein